MLKHNLDGIEDMHTIGSDDNSKVKPLVIHKRMLQGLILYHKRKCKVCGFGDSDEDVINWNLTEFESYCRSSHYQYDRFWYKQSQVALVARCNPEGSERTDVIGYQKEKPNMIDSDGNKRCLYPIGGEIGSTYHGYTDTVVLQDPNELYKVSKVYDIPIVKRNVVGMVEVKPKPVTAEVHRSPEDHVPIAVIFNGKPNPGSGEVHCSPEDHVPIAVIVNVKPKPGIAEVNTYQLR